MGARIALIVLNTFAALWAWAGLHLAGFGPGLSLLPVVVSLAILAWGWRQGAVVPARGPGVGRLIGLWTGIEYAALILVGNLVASHHRPELMLPLGAIIVGLHFIPLARGIPVRTYYATAAGLLLVGSIGLLLADKEQALVVGLGAALVLWGTAIALGRMVPAAEPAHA